jgi:hypothetical protein
MFAGDRGRLMNAALSAAAVAVAATGAADVLDQPVRLTGRPDPSPHYYKMTTEVVAIEADGRRLPADVYEVWIAFVPQARDGDTVTCRRFTVRLGDGAPVSLPALESWSYRFQSGADGFGIDQARFERLADERGTPLAPPVAYHVFNAFVDFHTLGQVLAGRTEKGGGIQDLRTIGQTLLHEAAHSEPPVSLGTLVEKGSTFKNGAITLELKGLSQVDGRRSAIVGYDSGDCSLRMVLRPAPQAKIEVSGGSRYRGELYVDLKTQWLLKATLDEIVVTETGGSALPQKVRSVIERRLRLHAIPREDFDGRGEWP